MAGNEELLKKVSSLEIENKSLKKGNIHGWILFDLPVFFTQIHSFRKFTLKFLYFVFQSLMI